jgi:hypothetical protein
MVGGPLAAEPVIPEGKGQVGPSGKFIPSEVADRQVREPDPLARLAELGAAVDGEKLRLGQVELDRRARSLSFPARINAVDGVIEYALVTATGKVHESLLVTDALPRDIHLACLLLGGGAPGKPPAEVKVEISWETNGPPKLLPLEDLVVFAKDHPQGAQGGGLAPGPWTYTGSRIDAGGFVASREGSIISLIADEVALVNNPRPGHQDDSLHVPNRRALPAAGSPVRVTFRPIALLPSVSPPTPNP